MLNPLEDFNVPDAPSLPLNVAQRIRETIDLRSRTRDRVFAVILRSAQNRLAAQRTFGSAEAVTEFEELAIDEMSARVQMVWDAIRSAYSSLMKPPTAQLELCLSSELSERAMEQVKAIEDLVIRAARIAPFQVDHFRRAVLSAAGEFIDDAWKEIQKFSGRAMWPEGGFANYGRAEVSGSRGHNRTH